MYNITVDLSIVCSSAIQHSKGFKEVQEMSVGLNLLLLMPERSDYKPVVPVAGRDNVLKSLNPAAHTRKRVTR